MCLLSGSKFVDLHKLVKPDTEGLSTLEEVETGLQHLIADVVSKHSKVNDFLKKINVKVGLQKYSPSGTCPSA